MKPMLTLTAAATLAAGAAFAQTTVVTQPDPVVVTTPSTTVQEVQTDPNTTGGGALGGAASGAIAGAAVGGPIGAAVGGIAGAVVGDVSEDALTPETRTYVMEHKTESVVLDGGPTVGAVIPETAPVQVVPNTQYQYVYVNDRPVLVEPGSRKIIHIYE
jgi:outer membrane lipoprotein SlyB